jgi:HPt (histidine-containing phosphotransfer) domain-containing protein
VPIERAILDKLRQLVGGDEADLRELIESFLDEAPGLMESLLASRSGPDFNSMRRSAHSLKSNARDMGALDFAGVCGRIEQNSASGIVPAPAEFDLASRLFDEASGELRRIIGMDG